jgi:hypothetical protein
MARRRSFIVLLGLALAAGAAGQSRNPYDGDLIFDESELSARPLRKPATADQRLAAEAQLARFDSATLKRFSGEEEFAGYVDAVRTVARARGEWWASARPLYLAQAGSAAETGSAAAAPVCPRDDLECLLPQEDEEEGHIIVTGSRIAPRNASITNNQMRGVEEGDIVKQIDHYLLILQDGRLFVVDMEARGGRGLALTDRVDVYRNPKSDMWYDEMLVFGERILVTGYSYDEEETELALFRLDPSGRLAREGVFRLSSNDYYSSHNYATRLIDDTLVVYTPLSVIDMARSGFEWPILRRWLPEADSDRDGRRGRPLLDAASIYRPVRTTLEPNVHTVSVCPLGAAGSAAGLTCRTTAFAGPPAVQWYVTEDQVYLWTAAGDDDLGGREDCEGEVSRALADTVPALLYRVPLAGGAPGVVGSRGSPPDHFAMQAGRDRFHALLKMESAHCYEGHYAPTRLRFFSIGLERLGSTLAEVPDSAFTPLPSVDSRFIVSRFTDTHLVFGGLSQFRRGPRRFRNYDDEYARRARAEPRQPAYALAVDRPSAVQPLDVRHSVIRAERVADDVVLTGYRDREGLLVSLIALGGSIGIASQLQLPGRFESEGRSHAFNSLVGPDGSGLLGLPTVGRISDSGREYWRSRASDLSFLRLGRGRTLSPLGELERRFDYVEKRSDGEPDEDGVPGYECEVSCVDWYGNSRPIFTDGRIFALMGTEIVEGRVAGDDILEVQRLNIALSPRPPSPR